MKCKAIREDTAVSRWASRVVGWTSPNEDSWGNRDSYNTYCLGGTLASDKFLDHSSPNGEMLSGTFASLCFCRHGGIVPSG